MRFTLLACTITLLLLISIGIACEEVYGCPFSLTIDRTREIASFASCDEAPCTWNVYHAPLATHRATFLYSLLDRVEGEILLIDEGTWIIEQVEPGIVRGFRFTRHGIFPVDPSTYSLGGDQTLAVAPSTWGRVKGLYQ